MPKRTKAEIDLLARDLEAYDEDRKRAAKQRLEAWLAEGDDGHDESARKELENQQLRSVINKKIERIVSLENDLALAEERVRRQFRRRRSSACLDGAHGFGCREVRCQCECHDDESEDIMVARQLPMQQTPAPMVVKVEEKVKKKPDEVVDTYDKEEPPPSL